MISDNIEAYIFDLDGTLIDSNGVWKEIDRLIFEKNNVSLSDSELNAAAAMNYSDFLGFLRSYGIVYTLDELKSEMDGFAVHSVFHAEDLPGYAAYSADDCPFCKKGIKLDAVVNGFGYSKL